MPIQQPFLQQAQSSISLQQHQQLLVKAATATPNLNSENKPILGVNQAAIREPVCLTTSFTAAAGLYHTNRSPITTQASNKTETQQSSTSLIEVTTKTNAFANNKAGV